MKNPFRTLAAGLVAALAVAPAHAQTATFANGNLETWALRSGVEAPTNWQTTDDLLEDQLGFRISTNTVAKTSTAHGGSFAAELQTQSFMGQGELPGVILLGNSLHGGTPNVPGGLPFTARPANAQFYYQLSGPGAATDSALAFVQLTRTVNGRLVVVASAMKYLTTPAASYTAITLPLNYTSALAPDSIQVGFSSGSALNITAGTTLRLDDITLTGTATASRDAALAAALSVSPNPSPDGRFRLSSPEPALQRAALAVLDATGRVVRRQDAPATAQAERTLDLSELPGGLYTLQLFTPTGVVSRKLSR